MAAAAARGPAERLLSVCSFGKMPVPYGAALALQEGLAALRHAGDIPDTLLVLQVRSLAALAGFRVHLKP